MSQPDQTEQQEPQPRPFAEVLGEVDAGMLTSELGEKLHDLIHQVRHNGKPGDLALKLTVKPVAGDSSLIQIVPAVAVKPPKIARSPSNFFVSRDGHPSRNHPSQMTDPALQPSTTDRNA